MLQPNPLRAIVREELAEVRRKNHACFVNWKKYHLESDRLAHLRFRHDERKLSRQLANVAVFVDKEGERSPIVPAGHFRRFRHSTRFKTFYKIWRKGRRYWRRRFLDGVKSISV